MENNDFQSFLLSAFTNMANSCEAGTPIYICHGDSERMNFQQAMLGAGWLQKQCIIWDKGSMVVGRQDYHWEHEPILYGWKDGASHYFIDDRTLTTVWRIKRPTRSVEHPTMKPVELCERAIVNSSRTGDIVLDLFLGSGSTLIAAEKTGRVCYGMELDPQYFQVIIDRYKKFTGRDDVKKIK